MITIEQVDHTDAEGAIYLVLQLLTELREEPHELDDLDAKKILKEWKANQDRFTAFVALADDGQRLGVITLIESFAIYANGSYGVINELYVPPEYRSKSVGKMLIETAKEYGRQVGWRRIDVTAPFGEKWDRTVKFYEREGFVHTGPKLRFKY